MSLIRALVAAGLSIVLPGAGHILIRDWIRALLFAGLFITTIVIFFPAEQLSAAASVGEATDIVFAETDTIDRFLISFIVLFAAVDALFRGMNLGTNSGTEDSGPSCPHCGRELDQDIDFCHWCTARLETGPEADTE